MHARTRWLPVVAVVACAVFVFSGSLAYFFAQDDFAYLARARGIAPPLPGLWRWLSGTAYFAIMRPLGLNALAYHAVNLIAHAACAGLLFALLRRRFSPPAAWLAAVFFAVHPALYTTVYWVSTLNQILALFFALLCIAFAASPTPWVWAAVPAFALSLLSKETTILLPAVLWISPGWNDGAEAHAPAPPGRRMRVRLALAAVAAAYVVMWISSDAFGVRARPDLAPPYAAGVGAHVVANAVTYLGWTAGTLLPFVRSVQDVAEPALWPWAMALVVPWLAGLLSPRMRASGWLAGGATFALLLAPVLSLRNHTYHYYLYEPMIGAAFCLAALVNRVFAPRATARAAVTPPRHGRAARGPAPGAHDPRLAWAAVIVAGAFLVLNGALLVRKIERMPFADGMLRADPVVDRARIARRVYDGLSSAAIPKGARLVFLSPESKRYELLLHPGADVFGRETYWEKNVRTALENGLAVRVMLPEARSVEFAHEYRAAGPDTRLVLYDPDGTVRVETADAFEAEMSKAQSP